MDSNKQIKAVKESLGEMQNLLSSVPRTIQGPKPVYLELSDPDLKSRFPPANIKGLPKYFDELKAELEESKKEQTQLRQELQAERDSHKHDVLKQILIGVVVALISSAITIIASKFGWPHG